MNELCRLIWCGLIGFFRSRASPEAEILVLRHQLNVLRRKSPKRPTFGSIESPDICWTVWLGTSQNQIKTAAQKQNPKKKPDAYARLRGSDAECMRSSESMS